MNNYFEKHKDDGESCDVFEIFHQKKLSDGVRYISYNDIYEYFGYPSIPDGQAICWVFGENEETIDMTNELDDCENALTI